MPDSNGAVDLSEAAAEESEVRDGDSVSREELAALMGAAQQQTSDVPPELAIACAGGLRVCTIPATVELDDGRRFIVEDFRAWGYCPYGVFAIGCFEEDAAEGVEEYRVFNGDKVNNITLDWKVYTDAIEEANEQPEEDTSGDEAAESSSD